MYKFSATRLDGVSSTRSRVYRERLHSCLQFENVMRATRSRKRSRVTRNIQTRPSEFRYLHSSYTVFLPRCPRPAPAPLGNAIYSTAFPLHSSKIRSDEFRASSSFWFSSTQGSSVRYTPHSVVVRRTAKLADKAANNSSLRYTKASPRFVNSETRKSPKSFLHM